MERIRRCLCCGEPNACRYKLRDGRLYQVCVRCVRACHHCAQQLIGAVPTDEE